MRCILAGNCALAAFDGVETVTGVTLTDDCGSRLEADGVHLQQQLLDCCRWYFLERLGLKHPCHPVFILVGTDRDRLGII